MGVKLNNGYIPCPKNDIEANKPYSQKYCFCIKYGSIFLGILTIIFMIVFSINNIACNTTDVNTTDVNTTDVNTTDVNTTDVNTTDVNTTDVNTTDVNTTESENLITGEDVVISNKTVIIDGGNDSIIINH